MTASFPFDAATRTDEFGTLDSSPYTITIEPTAGAAVAVDAMVVGRGSSDSLRYKVSALFQNDGGTTSLIDTAEESTRGTAGTGAISVDGSSNIVITVTPADANARKWTYELRVQPVGP